MNVTNYSLTDHFSSRRILHVSSMEAHDLLISTLYADKIDEAGPLTRVYNYGGSIAYVPIYEYLIEMVQAYGQEDEPINAVLPEFDFPKGPDSIAGARKLVIRDTPEEEIYLSLISLQSFLGFQTYSTGEGNMPKMVGPIVWFHKSLPKVSDKAKQLDAMICDQSNQLTYEVS